jgi:hypothetical protein
MIRYFSTVNEDKLREHIVIVHANIRMTFQSLSTEIFRLAILSPRSRPNYCQREYLRSSGASEATRCPRQRTQ